jgi:Alpha amylase, catalytic domain
MAYLSRPVIWLIPVPLGVSAFMKGGSIDVPGFHAVCTPGGLFFDDRWVFSPLPSIGQPRQRAPWKRSMPSPPPSIRRCKSSYPRSPDCGPDRVPIWPASRNGRSCGVTGPLWTGRQAAHRREGDWSLPWWQTATVYQIYPRSFADSNGDGIGDLSGITEHLGYRADLGIDVIWLSPVYRSPMAEFGYDISDHTDIDPLFGAPQDAAELIAAAHARGIGINFDVVLGHTSDQHPWFQAAASSRDNPYRNFYTWRDGPTPGTPDGGPPNNWAAGFPPGALPCTPPHSPNPAASSRGWLPPHAWPA